MQTGGKLIADALDGEGPLTRGQLTDRLTTLGVPPKGQAAFHLIRRAALTGRICHGPQRDGEAAFVLLDDWLPATGPSHSPGKRPKSNWPAATVPLTDPRPQRISPTGPG